MLLLLLRRHTATGTVLVGSRRPVPVVGALLERVVARGRRAVAVDRHGRPPAGVVIEGVVWRGRPRAVFLILGTRPPTPTVLVVVGRVRPRRRVHRRRVVVRGILVRAILRRRCSRRRQGLAVRSVQWCSRWHASRDSRHGNEGGRGVRRHRLEDAVYAELVTVGAFSVGGVRVTTAADLSGIELACEFKLVGGGPPSRGRSRCECCCLLTLRFRQYRQAIEVLCLGADCWAEADGGGGGPMP